MSRYDNRVHVLGCGHHIAIGCLQTPHQARFLLSSAQQQVLYGEVTAFAFEVDIVVPREQRNRRTESAMLNYLDALTFDFEREGHTVSCVLIYAEPDPDQAGHYQFVVAQDSGYEGIACVDDTARAALLALGVCEQTGDARALALAKRWLTFVAYMQYPDGSFANFIRNAAGVRNATGRTSLKGGYWWSARALWALGRAYRVTGDETYLQQFQACTLAPIPDGKINAVLALAELEVYVAHPTDAMRQSILDRCSLIVDMAPDGYFRDHAGTEKVHLWGYHQLHAVASAALILDESKLLPACERTVATLLKPDVRHKFWYSYPNRQKNGVCAYTVTPIVQGLSTLYRATGDDRYRELALLGVGWFYGRNEAGVPMYDPTTGRCKDGISDGEASLNCGAESSIEAGLSELERLALTEPL